MERLVTLPGSDTKPTKNNPLYLALPQSNFLPDEKLIMVGSGVSRSNCGNVKFGIRCSNFSCENPYQALAYHSCYRLSCPTCRDSAIRRLARSASERIEGMHSAYRDENIRVGAISHVQISTDPTSPEMSPEVLGTYEGYKKTLEHVYGLLRAHVRGYGGILIFHPWRQVHEDGTPCGVHKCPKNHKWEWSPHFHYLGWGYFRKADEFYNLTGWTYSKIGQGVKAGVSDESRRSIYGTAYYQMTHMGIFTDDRGRRQKGQAIRYVGMLSNAKGGFKHGGYEITVPYCEACGSEIHRFRVRESFGNLVYCDDWGFYQEVEKAKIWYVNVTKSRYR